MSGQEGHDSELNADLVYASTVREIAHHLPATININWVWMDFYAGAEVAHDEHLDPVEVWNQSLACWQDHLD